MARKPAYRQEVVDLIASDLLKDTSDRTPEVVARLIVPDATDREIRMGIEESDFKLAPGEGWGVEVIPDRGRRVIRSGRTSVS